MLTGQGERVIQSVVCGWVVISWQTGRDVIMFWNPGPRPGVSVLYRPAWQPPAGSQPPAPALPGRDRGLRTLHQRALAVFFCQIKYCPVSREC